MMSFSRPLAACMIVAAGGFIALPAQSQSPDYPSRPVTIIVPFSAGGATDVSARAIAQLLTRQMGQSFVIENKVGASGMIGLAQVARAAPDGYTLGWGGNSPMTVAPYLSKTPPYDPRKAFTPISTAAISSWALVTTPQFAANSLADVIAQAKAKPGKITIASSGIGSAPHLLGEVLKSTAGVDLLHVPFKGEIDGVNAMLGGQVDMMFTAMSTAAPQVKAGRLKGLAVTTPRRDPALPNLPSVAEAGQPELTFELFFGLIGPAGLPAPIVAKLAAAMKVAVADPSYKETMEKGGIAAVSSTPDEFAALLKRHNDKWLDIIRRNNITVE